MSGRGKGGKWTPYTFPHVWPSRSPDVERTHQAKVTVPWKEWPTRLLVGHDIQGGLSGSLPIDRFGSSKSATCPTSGHQEVLIVTYSWDPAQDVITCSRLPTRHDHRAAFASRCTGLSDCHRTVERMAIKTSCWP